MWAFQPSRCRAFSTDGQRLGWKAHIDLADGIAETVQWLREQDANLQEAHR